MISLPVFPRLLLLAAVTVSFSPSAGQAAFVTEYRDGGSWNSVYAQGFSPSVGANPAISLPDATLVELTSFEFFKSGNADSAADIRLAILDGLFADLTNLTAGVGPVMGLSTNTIASTASLGLGDAISFQFDGLELAFGGDYGAVMVTEGPGGSLTPVLVSALTANYVDDGTGTFRPETNYGTEDDFQYAVSNFIDTNAFGQFFSVFAFAGDANFRAEFNAIPEPTGPLLLLPAAAVLLRRGRAKS